MSLERFSRGYLQPGGGTYIGLALLDCIYQKTETADGPVFLSREDDLEGRHDPIARLLHGIQEHSNVVWVGVDPCGRSRTRSGGCGFFPSKRP